jgi:uncharacterized protein (TIGR02001 family)
MTKKVILLIKGNTQMKKLFLALLMAVGFASAQAQVSGNMSLTSDYRFRGVSQTQNAPAVQGGIDYTHSSGFYVGNWNSSVSSQLYTNGAGVESDLYAGYRSQFLGFDIDVGSMNYFYPRATNGTSTDFDTNELYVAVGKGPVTFKASNSLSNYFGTTNSKNSQYYQVDLVQPIVGKLSGVAHVGRTDVNNNSGLNYTDWNVGAQYDVQGWLFAGKYYTNSNQGSTFTTSNTVNGQKLYKDTFVVSVSKSF